MNPGLDVLGGSDRNDLIQQIEDLLGARGDRHLAEAILDRLPTGADDRGLWVVLPTDDRAFWALAVELK